MLVVLSPLAIVLVAIGCHLPDQLAEVDGTLALLDGLASLHNLRL